MRVLFTEPEVLPEPGGKAFGKAGLLSCVELFLQGVCKDVHVVGACHGGAVCAQERMCALVASDLETDYGSLGRLIVRVGRGIAVDRYGNPVRGLIKAKKEVEKGNICFVFPEGTRTHDGKVAEMKDGACYLAIKSNTPLIPVYISGAYQIWPRGQKWPHPWKGFFRRRKLRIYVGEPMYGKDFNNDAHAMTAALSDWMHEMERLHIDPEVG